MAWWHTALRVLGALVGLAVLVTSIWFITSNGRMRHVAAWLERLGPWGYVVLAALFLPISTPFGYGYTAVAFTCGALYGVYVGTLVIVVGADGGAVLAFIGIRYLFKDWFRGWLVSKRRLRLLMRAVDVNATKFAFLSRFTPIPWGIQNTIYAVSDLELWKFAVLTAVGGFPDQAIIAFMGSQVKIMLVAEGQIDMGVSKWIMLVLELLACFALAVLMIIFAKRAIDQTNADEDRRSAEDAARQAREIMGQQTGAAVAIEIPTMDSSTNDPKAEKQALLGSSTAPSGEPRDADVTMTRVASSSSSVTALESASAVAATNAPQVQERQSKQKETASDAESARLLSDTATDVSAV